MLIDNFWVKPQPSALASLEGRVLDGVTRKPEAGTELPVKRWTRRKEAFIMCLNGNVRDTQDWSCNLTFGRESLHELSVLTDMTLYPILELPEEEPGTLASIWEIICSWLGLTTCLTCRQYLIAYCYLILHLRLWTSERSNVSPENYCMTPPDS